jgi:uncharacterized membrane protein
MSDHPFFAGTRTGTIGGTVLVILTSITITDIVQTSILAAIGAAVSFVVTVLLKRLFRRWKK